MGTRSDIIIHKSDGTWQRNYCHWDGYLEHNGRILLDHYATQGKADALALLGDISSLAPKCTKPAGHTFDKPVRGYCVAYTRDRKEQNSMGMAGATLAAVWPEEGCWTEFTYVFDNGIWYVGNPEEGTQTLVKLSDALAVASKHTVS